MPPTMYDFIPLKDYVSHDVVDMQRRAQRFYEEMKSRRSVRHFSDKPVPRKVIEDCVRTAGTAPSGAHQQPWHFVVVEEVETKRQIRAAAEEEERRFYADRATPEWLEALAPLGTDDVKPYLEIAPYVVVLFAVNYGLDGGKKSKHYYVSESVGIAAGFFIAAVHQAGLVTLTHTPSPMGFLSDVLHRPPNERAFLVLPVGYPAEDARVPDIERKSLQEIATFI